MRSRTIGHRINAAGSRSRLVYFPRRNQVHLTIASIVIGIAGTTATYAAESTVERELKAIIASRKVPRDLEITYSDMHGLWGGQTIVIGGQGAGERVEKTRGGSAPKIVKTAVRPEELMGLIKLLIDLRAWEQRTPERTPVPDESRATLTITVNRQTSTFWEWSNEMSRNKRLAVIRQRMAELTPAK